MSLPEMWEAVRQILETIDFDSLYEGFRPYPFALYNAEEAFLEGKMIPRPNAFMGNTSIEFQGELLAIWDMDIDPVEDPEHLAFCLIHEMFHCHQRANDESRYPSDLDLLKDPDDLEYFVKKYHENNELSHAYENKDIESFRRFAALRAARYAAFPDIVREEWKVETIEGMAEYVALKAFARINPEKFRAVVHHHLGKLREESELLFDTRRIAYFSGAIFFLCLERFGFTICNTFQGQKTAYEENPIDISGVTAEVYPSPFISTLYESYLQEKKDEIEEKMKNSKYIECRATICAYDPMNMIRMNDLILCRHFVGLKEETEVRMIQSPLVLKLAEGSNRQIIAYYLKD